MSTHKHFDRICCVVLVFTLLLTVFFVNAESFGIKKEAYTSGYENRLFDASCVHTVDIVMDNWDEFLANCKNEEYYSCSVVIDNEAYKNVAIRAKGNTSLTQVESYGNNRYSFKIEFDHYDSAKTYYGLDKLCLNNIIQDNTYMKDYLTYQMMAQIGVASPLCSYVNITVNGEDWGLYLAVEGIEEAFLQRNYGNDYGELYKPDSTGMGGGRGNGEKFDMDEFSDNLESENTEIPNYSEEMNQPFRQMPDNTPPNNSNSSDQISDSTSGIQHFDRNMPDEVQGDTPSAFPNGELPFDPESGDMPDNITTSPDGDLSQSGGMQDGNVPQVNRQNGMLGEKMSSDDVLLKYIDDEPDSYSNIFDNAKTDISDSDKKRLIESLRKLSDGEDLENTVDIEAVIRYFVVHNFVLNFDSYTGTMIHNYYLYEKEGQMQMIPWDYNLAFGGFDSAGSATNLINYPIDSPVSGGSTEDRPMIAWIFASEEYTELYHRYFSEFISEWFESGNFENMIDSVSSMISPYIENDPSKFCTYEEFETGISTLKEFCLLRAESVEGQLNGHIGSTSDAQQSGELVDAGDLQISDMGTMQNSVFGGMNKPDTGVQNQQESADNKGSEQTAPSDKSDRILSELSPSGITENNTDSGNVQGRFNAGISREAQNPDSSHDEKSSVQYELSVTDIILTAVSAVILAVGIIFACLFRHRK